MDDGRTVIQERKEEASAMTWRCVGERKKASGQPPGNDQRAPT